MGEGQAGIGAGESRIVPYGYIEEMSGEIVFGAGEAVHVPEAAMIGLPSIERVRRLQHGAVAFDRLDLGGDRRHDAVADVVEHREDIVGLALEGLGPDDPGRAHLDKLDGDDQAARRLRTVPVAT